MTLYEFTVVGEGYFPVDMLRYDQCWPAREANLPVTGFHHTPGRQCIELVGLRQPTEGRWLSFGWKVEGKVRKLTGR